MPCQGAKISVDRRLLGVVEKASNIPAMTEFRRKSLDGLRRTARRP
jgi:hypothetical protein